MPSLIELAARECNLTEEWVTSVLRSGHSRVKKIPVPHKNKPGYRVVSRPSAELEILQRWLVLKFLNGYRVHPMAMAFLPKRSILSNANLHKHNRYFIRIDFKDFFPSIRLNDLVYAILSDKDCQSSITQYEGYREFLSRVCFDFSDSLPVGYISSPVISNIVMWDFDLKISELVASKKPLLGNGVVSRYADDIIFSTDAVGGCKRFFEFFKEIVSNNEHPKVRINDKKTAYSSKAGGGAMVTGLRVCSDSHVTVDRRYKDKIRLMLSLERKGTLKPEDVPILRGHLSYVRSVAPAFFSKICLKYLNVIEKFI